MSEATEHAARLLRAYHAQEKQFVERRFPLRFAPEVPALRELYSQAKGLHWNPETELELAIQLDAEGYGRGSSVRKVAEKYSVRLSGLSRAGGSRS